MQTLRPSLRIHVAGIAVLLCVTLAFVAVTTKDAAPRIFFVLFCLALTGTLLALYRKESVLAEGHLVVSSTVTELRTGSRGRRSEEHTSELQSLRQLVCRLLLEKKKYMYDLG